MVLDEKFLVEFAEIVFRFLVLYMRFSFSLAFLVICGKEIGGYTAASGTGVTSQLLAPESPRGGEGVDKSARDSVPVIGSDLSSDTLHVDRSSVITSKGVAGSSLETDSISVGGGSHGGSGGVSRKALVVIPGSLETTAGGVTEDGDASLGTKGGRSQIDVDGVSYVSSPPGLGSGVFETTGISVRKDNGAEKSFSTDPSMTVGDESVIAQSIPGVRGDAAGDRTLVDGVVPKPSALVNRDTVSGSSLPAVSAGGSTPSLATGVAPESGHVSSTTATTAIGVPIVTATFQTSSIATQEKLFFANFHNAAQQLSLLGIKAVGLATQIQAIRGHMMMLKLIDEHIATLTKDETRYTVLLAQAHVQLGKVARGEAVEAEKTGSGGES